MDGYKINRNYYAATDGLFSSFDLPKVCKHLKSFIQRVTCSFCAIHSCEFFSGGEGPWTLCCEKNDTRTNCR